ncbi:MAG: c-type cytochrome [Burkholderiaceae bacterium]
MKPIHRLLSAALLAGATGLAVAAAAQSGNSGGNSGGNSAKVGSGAGGSGASGAGADQSEGAQIATKGTSNGVTACVSCHGAQGQGMPAGGFPRIAGQSREYLSRQLQNFANGSRNNPVMSPIAKAMTPQQMELVSEYYASLYPPGPSSTEQAGDAALQRGRTLSNVGDSGKRVQACINCHGPNGAGEQPVYPYLAGQHASYLVSVLNEWKSGARNTDPSGQMQTIAKRLSDDDIKAVAAYYARQMPPQEPQLRNVMNADYGGRKNAVPSGPVKKAGGNQAPQGVGSEQGAPTTGGSQGIGGGGGGTGTGPSGSPGGKSP